MKNYLLQSVWIWGKQGSQPRKVGESSMLTLARGIQCKHKLAPYSTLGTGSGLVLKIKG